MNKPLIVTSLLILVLLAVGVIVLIMANASRGTDMYSQLRRISASEAREKMRDNPDAIILDVRTVGEFSQSRIPGAISLPDYAIHYRAETLLTDLDALILVYCQGGARSRTAAYELLSMGYTNVFDFGGFNNWPYDIED